MTEEMLIRLGRDALLVALQVGGPLLGVGLVLGLAVSVLQAVTQAGFRPFSTLGMQASQVTMILPSPLISGIPRGHAILQAPHPTQRPSSRSTSPDSSFVMAFAGQTRAQLGLSQ